MLNQSIGKMISNARKVAGLTQAELSEIVGVSEKYLSRIECGRQMPNVVIVIKLCEVLNISADNLFSLNQAISSDDKILEEISAFSTYEQEQIVKIIKIIKEIKINR